MNHRTERNTFIFAAVLFASGCSTSPEIEDAPSETQTSTARVMNPKSKAGSGGASGGRSESIDTAASAEDDAGASDVAGKDEPAAGTSAAASAGTSGGVVRSTAGTGATVMTTATTEAPPADRGPYYMSGRFQGYYWTALHGVGTTIRATNFNLENYSMPICITGSVATSPDSSSNAMLGINLNQTHSAAANTDTLAPQQDGITISVVNKGGSPLRLQIQTPNGATDEKSRWCAYINGSGGFIPWSQFTTTCWDDFGTRYNREPISSAMLLIPGNPDMAVPFDVCWNTIVESADTGGATASKAAAAGSAALAAGSGGGAAGSAAPTAGNAAP